MAVRKRCFVCGRFIAQGLQIRGCYLCTGCEHRIARVEVTDPYYRSLMAKMKTLWGRDCL
ncbi:MAG: sigma factor G inhibitor Gin [Limnochordia bacterium]